MAPERDKADAKCNKCERSIRKTDEALQCEGICKYWFHAKCVGFTSKEYNMILQLGSRVIWCCNECKTGTYIPEEHKFLQVVKETYAEMEKSLTDKLDKIENNLVTNLKRSYADITSCNIEKDIKRNQDYDIKKKEKIVTYIIKPKRIQKSEDTLTEVQEIVNPAETHTIIHNIKNINKGGIVIKTTENDQSEIFYKNLVEKTSAKYTVNISKQKDPRIKIIGVNRKYESHELMHDLKLQNQNIDETDEMKIVYQTETKTKKWIIFVEVKPKTYHKMIEKKYINIGWQTCKIFEDIYVKICTNCNRYGHKHIECKEHTVCKTCGENHSQKDCKSNCKSCNNCKFYNEKYNNNYNTTHIVNSEECSVFKNQQKLIRERINYCVI